MAPDASALTKCCWAGASNVLLWPFCWTQCADWGLHLTTSQEVHRTGQDIIHWLTPTTSKPFSYVSCATWSSFLYHSPHFFLNLPPSPLVLEPIPSLLNHVAPDFGSSITWHSTSAKVNTEPAPCLSLWVQPQFPPTVQIPAVTGVRLIDDARRCECEWLCVSLCWTYQARVFFFFYVGYVRLEPHILLHSWF